MGTILNDRWKELCARFSALTRREKLIVALAIPFVVLYGGYSFWIDPAWGEKRRLRMELANKESETQNLTAQLAALRSRALDPDAENRARLAEAEQRLAQERQRLAGIEGRLLPPTQARQFLQNVLAKSQRLELRSLKTLPPQSLLAERAAGNRKEQEEKSEVGQTPAADLYLHGLEVRVAGTYSDLVAYLLALQDDSRRFFWGDLALSVERHPTSVVTFKLYTLSLEPIWLAF